MFQGLIEELGVVSRLDRSSAGGTVTIAARLVLEDLRVGASLAVNGVCLTITACGAGQVAADLSPETLRSTTFGALRQGDGVNLERAVRLSDRIGGHLLSGHVDAVGAIRARRAEGQSTVLAVEPPRHLLRYCVTKGSIAVDGVSLTINDVTDTDFSVTIIPQTAKVTTLGLKEPGAAVNLEADLVVKSIDRLLQR